MNPFEKRGQPLLIGVVHLPPLPGSPMGTSDLRAILDLALTDAKALRQGGVDGLIIENLGDAPFVKESSEPWTIAAMTRVACAIRGECPNLVMGINVLRNDALSALGIAATVEADFIRVNIHTGVMATDQGIIEGRARETLLARSRLGSTISIAADVLVKHASPIGSGGGTSLEQAARDTAHRGRANALIVSGSGTGESTSPQHLERVLCAVPQVPVWVGSGIHPDVCRAYARADAWIVGTWLHEDSDLSKPICSKRVGGLRKQIEQLPG